VAFSFRLGVELLEHTGGPIRSFSLGGGGVKSSLWCQIFADALQREVRALSDVTETSLAGAAFMGAQALGWESEPWLPKTGAVIEPEPSRSDAYERNYRQFVRLAPLLKSIRD
jgi:xylulokinase